MENTKVSAVQFRNSLFEILKEMENEPHEQYSPKKHLEKGDFLRTRRTNFFLGSRGNKKKAWEGDIEPLIKYEENNDDQNLCVLSRLHKKLYNYLYDPTNKNENCFYNEATVYYENLHFDCTFMNEYKKKSEKPGCKYETKYPTIWSYDWIIEVENEFEEFTFTMRSLLDVVCNSRMGIFFNDSISDEGKKNSVWEEMNIRFKCAWEEFTKQFPAFDKFDFSLYALLFPNSFVDMKTFLEQAMLFQWDENCKTFILIREKTSIYESKINIDYSCKDCKEKKINP